jgi:hypothetical protein
MMTDSEEVDAMLTAGVLDLDSNPSWGNGDSTDGSAPGSISGDEGRETVTVSVSGNPSYVWFRTQCKQCTSAEETLQVRFGLDFDVDGSVDEWLPGFEGGDYLSLRAARERLGGGVQLGELAPEDTWELVVEWTTDGPVTSELDVTFDFDFYATQTRHVMNTGAVAPDWDCPDVACEPPGGEEPPSGVKEISFVALCSPDDVSPSDVTLEFSDDGTAVTITDVAGDVTIEEVLLKYGLQLDVFAYDAERDWYATGSAQNSFTQKPGLNGAGNQGGGGDTYPNTDPVRSNSDPCPEHNWIKYDVGEGWTSGGGAN